MIIVDGHCDSLSKWADGCSLLENARGHFNLKKMRQGKINLQFLAIFIENKFLPYQGLHRALYLIEKFHSEFNKLSGDYVHISSKEDLLMIEQGKNGFLLSLEGGEPLEESLEMLSLFYRLGIRSVGLTWNRRNKLADGVGESITGGGLTNFGKKVVMNMEKMGMVIDLAHIAEKGFWDVLKLVSKPIIVSHGNCRKLCDHPRNLTDLQIKAVADCKGMIGITFVPNFLGEHADIDTVINHVDHINQLLGNADHVGFGSDFDGIDELPAGLENAAKYQELFERLKKRGYSEEDIVKIAGKNFLRILSDII